MARFYEVLWFIDDMDLKQLVSIEKFSLQNTVSAGLKV